MKTSIRTLVAALAASAAASTAHGAGLTLGTTPLYLGSSVAPLVMLTVSKDEQLFQKLYNDYTDLDGDGLLDITYKHSINYYGYFDGFKCYNYDTAASRFVPIALSPASNKYCETVAGGRWSGNFLNWATMTRADAVRKILYGGLRSSDTAALTVLERAQIPFDTHAFAKYYHGTDINRLTPFTTTVTTAASGAATGATTNAYTVSGAQPISSATPKHFRNVALSVCKGDQVQVSVNAAPANYVVGYVSQVNGAADCSTVGGGFSIVVKAQGVAGAHAGSAAAGAYTVTSLSSTGITVCNVTDAGSTNLSHTTTNPPLIKVAKGNFAMWANNDITQCQWNPANNTRTFGGTGSNGNEGALSGGLPTVFPVGSVNWAAAHEPIQATHGLAVGGVFNFVARVEACKASVLGFERCKAYGSPAVYKPIGLLQFYGEPDLLYFGLMTGSYAKNKSGGVLRKNAGSFTNEVDTTNGTFLVPAGGGIVDTLNRLRIYGYDYATTSYGGAAPDRDGCGVVTSGSGTATLNRGDAQEGICTSWGNPVAESYLESLRYLAGKTVDASFTYAAGSKDDQVGGAPGLPKPAWVDPMADTTRYCRPLNVLVFSANVSSFDNDQLGNVTQLNTASSAAALTNSVGTDEAINGNNFFVGNDGAGNNNELCTLKNGISLGSIFGICPESPRGRGSYLLSGIAHHAHTNRIRVSPDPTALAVPPTNTRALKVNTYGITLAANSGTVQIPVGANTVTLLPIARVQDIIVGNGAGGLIDFKVIQQTATSGKFFVQWEVSQQGADRDLDLWGVISYTINTGVTPNTITVTTDVISANPSGFLGFGYVIAGTNQDGAHFHSGYNTFSYTYNPGAIVECTNCQTADAASSKTYNVTGGSAQILKDPLYYAAKYGGFNDVNANNTPDQAIEWDSKRIDGSDGTDGIPDNYFPVTNPAALEAALDRAFIYILQVSSASSVATNSTSLTTGSRVYQARFNSNEWSGQLLSFTIQPSGVIDPTPNFDAGQLLPTSDNRKIVTYSPGATPGTAAAPVPATGVPFRWTSLTTGQQTDLRKDGSSQIVDSLAGGSCTSDNVPIGCTDRGSLRLEWLRGNPVAEGTTATAFRVRPSTKLADIVNSTPRFVGPPSASFTDASYLAFRSAFSGRRAMLYVGSNGGMFHGFDATTTAGIGGVERFAYVPNKMFQNLTRLTTKPYSHRYFVDGTPSVNDACFGTCAALTDWKTVAVGGYNSGGQGYYALDVTDPDSWVTETVAARSVLWEFTDVNDPDLGFSYSKPLILKMANGRWAAVFGNGYNNSIAESGELACDIGTGTAGDPYARSDAQPGCSTSLSGHAYLFVLFLDGGTDGVWTQGTDYYKISTNTGTDLVTPSNLTPGTPNGIATPVSVDSNGDGLVDFVYAGDLVGNLWKFDLTSASPAAWTVASAGTPLFIAQDASGNRQTITSAPVLFPHPGGGFIVLFGTGKYMEITDDTGPFGMNAFYGIWDKLDNTTVARSDLMQQKVLNVSGANLDGGLVVGTNEVRLTSAYVPNYTATDRINALGTFGDADTDPEFVAPTLLTPADQRGWLLEMPNSGNGGPPSAPLTGTGEKIVFDPLISTGKLVFTTLLPSTQPCDAGGTSFIMDMDPVSGSRLSFSPFDLNNDNTFTSADFVTFGGKQIAVSGLASTIGIVPQPTVIQGPAGGGMEIKVLSGSSGALSALKENAPITGPTGSGRVGRRITWRELLTN